MKKIIPALFLLTLISCSINGGFQGLYSYYNKTNNKNPDLLVKTDSQVSICDIAADTIPKIYVVTGPDIKECLNKSDKSVIYVWGAKCRSKFCYPLNVIQKQCDKENIDLFIVAEYYDEEYMNLDYKTKRPIFGIDTKYYKTSRTSKYLSNFIYDVSSQKDVKGRFIYFEKAEFKAGFKSIDSLKLI